MKHKLTGRKLSIALALIMILALLPLSATADTGQIGNSFYENGKTYYNLGNLEGKTSSVLLQEIMNSRPYSGNEGMMDYWYAVAATAYMSKFGTDPANNTNDRYLAIDDNDAFRLFGGDNTTVRNSGGVQTASNLANAYAAMTDEILAAYDGNRNKNDKANIVLSLLSGLSDNTSAQPVAYYWQGGFRNNTPTGHYIVLGVFFSDFKLQPIIPGNAGYARSDGVNDTNTTFTGGVTNASSLTSGYSQGLELNITESASNSIQNTSSYTFGQSLSIASTVSAEIDLSVLTASTSITTTLGVTFQEAFSTATTTTDSLSKSTSFSSSTSLNLPAHTQVVLEQTEGEIITTVEYDCPVALTYSVTCVAFTLDPAASSANALGEILVSFPNTGASYGAQSDFASRFPLTPANDANMINWELGIKNLETYKNWTSDHHLANESSGETNHVSIMEPVQAYMGKKEGLTPTGSMAERQGSPIYHIMNTLIPMSLTGGQYTYSAKGISTKIYDISPLYPLDAISPTNGAYDYDMTFGENFYVDNIELTGKNAQKVDYFGFNKAKGYWILVDANGDEADSAVARLVTDFVTQNTCLVAGNKEGSVYLKYMIDEDAYTYYSNSAENLIYTTNGDISKTAAIKVNVSNIPFEGTITVSSQEGSAIEGYINDPAINLDAVEGLTVTIQGSNGVYYERPVVWQAQEPASSGIEIVNNRLTLTKTGTFHVCARIGDYYSNWITVKANPERELDSIEITDTTTPSILLANAGSGSRTIDLSYLNVALFDQYGSDWPDNSGFQWKCDDSAVTISGGLLTVSTPGSYQLYAQIGGITSNELTLTMYDGTQEVTSVSANRISMTSAGGANIITLGGSYLPNNILVAAFDASGAMAGSAYTSGSLTSQKASLNFPANTSTTSNVTYTVKYSFDGGLNYQASPSATVSVAAASSGSGGGGGGGGGGSASTSTQKIAEIGGVDVSYTIDSNGGVTLKPTTAQLEKLLAAIGSDGVLNIAVSGIDAMKSAIIEIDLTRLTASDKLQIFSFSALDMELRFPAGALKNMKKLATTLRFSLKPGSLIFELTDANGKNIDWYDYANPATASMKCELPQDISTGQLVMVCKDGSIVPRSWYAGGRIYGKIHEPGTYAAAVKSFGSFTDTAGLWMDEAVGYMAVRGIVEGVGNNQFDRSGTITRAHFVAMLMRALDVSAVTATGEIPVVDYANVPDWAKEYVIIAKALGITLADGDGNFNPNEAITRQEMFYMAYEAMGACGMLPEAFTQQWINFSDWDGNVKAEYSDAIQNLTKLGLVNGNADGTLNPNGSSTRTEGAQFLYNILKYDAK